MKPAREHATNNQQTYFVTADTWTRRAHFRDQRWAELFIDVLLSYRGKAYLLHEFVVMPDHCHAIITPLTSLERAAQFIKGGFSYRAKKELGSNVEVWQRGFSDHRIRDAEDYDKHAHYIWLNPVKRHLCECAEGYPYGSASKRWDLDPVPQRLKPLDVVTASGTAKAVPFQSAGGPEGPSLQGQSRRLKPLDLVAASGAAEAVPFQTVGEASDKQIPRSARDDKSKESAAVGAAEGVPLQSSAAGTGRAKGAPFQSTAAEATPHRNVPKAGGRT